MKKIIFIFIIIANILTASSACQDRIVTPSPLISLVLMNAATNSSALQMRGFSSKVAYASMERFTLNAGQTPLYLFPIDDSLHPYVDKVISTAVGDIYSLYISGEVPNIDTLFVKETTIPRFSDSTMAIRFINLTLGNIPISINIAGRDYGSEIDGLGYKVISDFKIYSAKNTDTDNTRTFEIRNANTGDLLISYDINGDFVTTGIPRFHSITLVVIGSIIGSSTIDITRINNF